MRNLDILNESWPAIVARSKIDTLSGGMLTKGTMANLDSEGKGPRRIKIGKKVGYLREDLIAWLKERQV